MTVTYDCRLYYVALHKLLSATGEGWIMVKISSSLRACLHGVGDPGLDGLVSFVFTLWGTQNKRNLPH